MTTLGTATNYSPTLVGVATQLGLASAITFSGFLAFEINRRWQLTQHLYQSRCYLEKNATPMPPSRPLAWVWTSLTLTENFYLNNVGLDAVMYIRFLNMAFQLLLFTVLTVGAILMPLNFFAQQAILVDVEKMSIGNIPDGSNMLWVHWLLTYFFSISTLYLLFKNTRDYIEMRTVYLQNQARKGCIHARTVIVTHIPDTMKHEERLRSFYASLGIGEVDSVTLVRQTGKISRKIQRREKMLRELEHAHIKLGRRMLKLIKQKGIYALDSESKDTTQRLDISNSLQRLAIFLEHQKMQDPVLPVSSDSLETLWNILAGLSRQQCDKFQEIHKTGILGTGQKVVSIDYYLRKFNSLDRRIAELRHVTENAHYYKPTGTAFITFKTQSSAQLCSQSIAHSDSQLCHIELAPEPRDVLWANHTVSPNGKWIRRVIVNLSLWALTILWLFPSTYFVSFASYDKLSERWPFLVIIGTANPWLKSVVQNVLPSILISLFMVAMPNIFLGISTWECFSSYSALESAVVNRYYRFAIFNVLFVFLLGFAFIEVILEVIQTPTSITSVLAKNLPQGAAFFINYVVLQTASHGLEIAQIGGSLFHSLLFANRWYARTPRDLQSARRPWAFPFYYYFPTHILVLVICITYSMINPLILLCGVMYFGIGLIVYKYQFAFVYVKRYEYNGKYWRYVFRYVSDGLLIFQLSMIGVLALKQAFSPSIGLVPLLGGTVAFKVICRSKFRDRMKYIPLERLYERETETEAKETETNIEISVNDGQLFSNMNHGENTTNFSTSPLEKSHSSGQTHDSLASRGPSFDRNQSSINTQSDFFGTNPSPLPNTSYGSNCSNAPNLNINSSPSPERYLNSSGSINSLWLKKSQSTGLIHDRFGKNTAFSNYRDFLPVSKCTKVCGVQSRSSIESSSNQFLSTEDPKTLSSIEGTPIPICHVVEESIKPNNKQRWGKIQQQIINNPLLSLFLHPFTNSSGPVSEDLAEVPPNPGTPCRETYQDDTDPYETYIHPDFIRPLPKSLWLPKNPLKKLHDLDSDTIEVKTVLSSSLLEITSAQTDNDIAHTTVNNKSTFALGYLGQSLPRRVKSNLSTHENARRGHRIRQPSKVDFRYDAIFNTQTNQLELVNRSKASLDPNSNEMESLRLRRDTNGFIDVIRSGLISIGNRSEILLPWTHRKEYEEKEQDILESRSVRSSVSSGLSI